LLVYARYAEEKQKYNPHSGMFYGGALGLFTLGLLAKPMLVTLPFVLLLLDWWPLRRIFSATTWNITFGRATLEKLPFFALSAASCVITLVAQQPVAVRSLDQYPLPLRLENSLLSYARYLWKTVWPADLAIIYPLPQSIPMASMALTVVVLAALTWLAWRSRRACPALLMGWLWFLGMLVPVIGLMQVGGQAMADRYTYLPHIGLFFAVMYGIQTLAKRWRIKTVALAAGAGLILIGCLAGTAHQLPFWQNSETLFRHALAVTHKNPIAHINLGVALQQQGERQAALEQFRAALRLDPTYVQAHNNLAILLDEMDQNDEAISEYQESLRLSPNAPLVHCNFGTLLAKLGRFDEAMAQYVEAARLAPEDPRPHYLMGRAALRQGQSSTAVAHFQDALLRSRNDFKTLTQLARVLASDPDPQVRNGQQAVALAEQASLLTGGSNPFVLDTLAMAYAEAGRLAEAEQAVQKALDLAAASGEELPEAVKQRRHLYSSGQPFRESFTNAPSEESAITRP
jgi:Tfp pilus assembly protein PilF